MNRITYLNKIKTKCFLSAYTYACKRVKALYRTENSWAIVSGCTSGIGKSYAEFLTKNDFNMILISRNESKLNLLKEELRMLNKNNKIETISFDFSHGDTYNKNKYEELKSNLAGKKIKILVNNVGTSSIGGPFEKSSIGSHIGMINTNINSCLFLTQIFLSIRDSDCKESYAIVNVSSYFGTRPVPGTATYSSTKSFISNFSKCLHYERKFNLDVQCIEPLFVKTNMVRKWKANFFVLNPEEIVVSSFIRINNYTVRTYGNWRHALQSFILNLMPNFLFCRISNNYFYNQYARLSKKQRKNNK